MHPPIAKRIPSSSTHFGISLPDDYAWLREKENPEVSAYLEAENAYTEAIMAHTKAFQERLYKEMLGRIKEDDSSVPYRYRNYWYYTRTEEGKEYGIHCRKHLTLDAPEEILLDENQLAEGHDFFDLGDLEISTNERFMAYTVDLDGSERYTLRVMDLDTREHFADQIDNISGEIEWANDNATLYYVTLDEETHRPEKLFRHVLGSKAEDTLVFHEPDEAYFLGFGKGRDEEYFFIELDSNITTELLYFSANDPEAQPILFWERQRGIELGMEHHEGWWYIYTNEDAVNFRLLRTRIENPGREHWEEVVAHDPAGKLDGIDAFKDHLVIFGRRNGLRHIQIRHFRTGEVHDIAFPEPVYTLSPGSTAEYDTPVLRIRYTSLTTPASVYDYDMNDRSMVLLKQQEVLGGYDATEYDSARIFATASDGMQIPISLVWKKSLRKDGPMPLYLYAYGSYGVSLDPGFNSNRLSLLDRGMVFAMAHIRGGGEMGRLWYDHGKLLSKLNTFTDFIASAEHLIATGWTAADRLAIAGGSAGGLLIGTVLNMRPDLFRVAEAHVPFVDVMNTMLDPSIPLTVIEYDEWGNPTEEASFRYMAAYSPYDNVDARPFPDLLITAGLNDPRVHYWEPAKWCAKIRATKPDTGLVLLKTNMGAGHQGASGRYGALKELAFEHAFVLDRLGLPQEV